MSTTSAKGKIFDFGILKRIISQVGPYRIWFRLTGLLVLLLACLVWIRPALIGFAIDAFVVQIPVEQFSGFKGWLIHIVFWWFTFGVVTAPFNAALALETGGEDFLLLIGTMILIYGPILFFLQRAVVRRRKRLLEKELELAAA